MKKKMITFFFYFINIPLEDIPWGIPYQINESLVWSSRSEDERDIKLSLDDDWEPSLGKERQRSREDLGGWE